MAPLHDDEPRFWAKQVRKHAGGVACRGDFAGTSDGGVSGCRWAGRRGARRPGKGAARAKGQCNSAHLGGNERGGRAEGSEGKDRGAHLETETGCEEEEGREERELRSMRTTARGRGAWRGHAPCGDPRRDRLQKREKGKGASG